MSESPRDLSRAGFVGGTFASLALAVGMPAPGDAGPAHSGPWCEPLTKAARENVFDFTLNLLDGNGQLFTLSDFAGKPVWLNFFASWCGPCNLEAADIVRIAAKYGDAVHVVGIDVKEAEDPVRDFRKRHAITYPIALDTTGSVFDAFKFRGLPTHMFVDSVGAITCVSIGDLTPEQMDNEVAAAIVGVPRPQARASGAPASAPPSGSPDASPSASSR